VTDDDSVLDQPAPAPDEILTYGRSPDQVIDLYRSHAQSHDVGVGLVVFLHGGFWRQRYDRTHARPLAVDLAAAGPDVALVEYRRVGGSGGWPQTVDDVHDGIAHVLDAVRPAGPVVVGGHSAGGHLALWAAATWDGTPWLRTVSLCGVADLIVADRLHLGDDATRAFLGGSPQERPEVWLEADPARLPAPVGEVRLIHAGADASVPIEVARSYLARHPKARLTEVAGDHFVVIDPGSPAWPTVRSAFVVP
jgi:acetyl esterase/lipase